MKKRTASGLLSLLLCFLLLFSPFCVLSSSAVDYNAQSIDLDVATITQSNSSVNTVNVTDYTSTMVVEDLTMSGVSMKQFYNTNSNYYSSGFVKTTVISAPFYVNKNHSYTVDFYSFLDSAVGLSVRCYIYVFDGNGNNLQTISLFEVNYLSAYNLKHHSFDFCLDDYSLPSGYSLRFGADFFVSDSHSYPFKFRCSDFNYVDNDDSSGLLNTIITAIGMVWTDMCDGFTNLGTSISSGLNSLGNTINNKLDSVWGTISEIKQKVIDKADDIKNGISDKLQDITDEIKSWFIPSEGYFDTWTSNFSSWASQHLGFIYTAASLFSGFINSLKNIVSSDIFAFVFPSVTIPLPSGDITLWSDVSVPMSQVLDNSYMNAAYLIYKAMLGVILGFALFKYSERVYDKIMIN